MNVNEEDTDRFTAPDHDVDRGHENASEMLLQNDVHVDGKPYNSLNDVPDLKSAQLLFQAKGNLNARDEIGNSPLHTAIRKKKYDLVEYFLSVGADILCTNAKGETPLHTLFLSSIEKPQNLTRKLIEMGANVNSKDSQGRTPLHLAVMYYCLDISKTVDILIKAGVSVIDVDLKGMNPIHYFIKMYGSLSVEFVLEYIDLLVINDSVANSKNAIGQTILHLAISADATLQVLEYLVQKGCRPTIKDGRKRSLLHCLVERDADDFVDILSFLLDKGLNINGSDIWGQTALHLAVEKENKSLLEALVERGADVNVKDAVGREPLHIAAERWDVICDFLIRMGANINAQDKHQSTPLHFAAWSNNGAATDVLIKAGCDVELRDAYGQTAEEMATFWFRLHFLQIMHEKDGNNNLELEQGKKLLAKYGGEFLQLETFQEIIADSSEESLRTSGTLDEFLSCLISKPGIGKVLGDPEAIEIREVLDRFATNVVKRIADSHPKMRCTLYHAGSSSEGTKTKYPDEFDYAVCFDELSENVYPDHESEDIFESVQLVPHPKKTNERVKYVKHVYEEGVYYEETSYPSVSNYTRIFLKDHTSYEYSEFTQLKTKAISNCTLLDIFMEQLSNIVFDESFPRDERLVIKDVDNDPKLSLLWKGSRYKTLEIGVDFVPAVRLPSWPDKFRIPSQLLGPDLLQLPCLAVPKTTSESHEDLWRCSLCLVETAIIKRCLPRMRNSYIAAKSLINSAAICPHVSVDEEYGSDHDSESSDEDFEPCDYVEAMLPSYILKMAFFHSIEEKAAKDGLATVFIKHNQDTQRSESDSDITTCEEPDPEIVKAIFMKCEDWLSNQFVPSFFNPRQNVLGSAMLNGNVVKAQMFVKYILKLSNEK